MTNKIRLGDILGIDIDRVVVWEKFESKTDKTQFLLLYFSGGNENSMRISESVLGPQAFARFHELLVNQFAIDLAAESHFNGDDDEYGLADEGSSKDDDGIKLEDIPY